MTACGRRVLVGVGNADRGDDGVGLAVCDAARTLLAVEGGDDVVEIWEVSADPSTLAVQWGVADRVVVVDAIVSGAAPGTVHDLDPDDVVGAHGVSTHGLGVAEAVRLSTALGTRPAHLRLLGIEAARFDHGAPRTPAVAGVVDEVAARALELLRAPDAAGPGASAPHRGRRP